MKLKISAVTKFLINETGGKIDKVLPIGQGDWSQGFFYQDGEQVKVVRFSQTDSDFRCDQWAASFSSKALPIPIIEKMGKAFDGYFAISPKVEGEMIDNLAPEELVKVIPSLMGVLNQLRLIDASTSGFRNWEANSAKSETSWREHLAHIVIDSPERRIAGWRQNLSKHGNTLDIFDRAYQKMLVLSQYCPEDKHIIHNDLLHFNVLVYHNKIAGVIDWGCVIQGDWLYDLSKFTTWQFYYPSMQEINFQKIAKEYFGKKGVSLSHFEKRLQCYQLHQLLDSLAYAGFRKNWKDVDMVTGRLSMLIK